jgi:hypothetical protein
VHEGAWYAFTYNDNGCLTEHRYDAFGGGPEDTRSYTYALTNDANGYMLTYVFTEGTGAVYRGTHTYTECL